MFFFDILNKAASRRTVLKAMAVAAVGVPSVLYAKDDISYPELLKNQPNLAFDKDVKVYRSSSSWNCGSKCIHNISVKNGRVIKLTSAGDIRREDSISADENIGGPGNPLQRRGCVRCYSYIQRNYQPDRLRYPLLQTKEKGNVNGFKRISWDEASKIAAENFINVVKESETLGYIPLLKNRTTTTSYLKDYYKDKPIIRYNLGNHSTGTHDAAKYETVGVDAYCNSITDILNSKFILLWAIDPSRTTYWIENNHWYMTKAKEQGIPIVSITTNFTDTAASISTGVSMKIDGKEYTLPKWIPCRPATDGALAVAVAYVIYKNGWHDTEFLGKEGGDYDSKRRCFGFYPNDTVISKTPVVEKGQTDKRYRTFATQKFYLGIKTNKPFVDENAKKFNARDSYNGAKFKVPAGESFVEYLVSREVEWANAKSTGENAKLKYQQPDSKAKVNDKTYNGVLEYVQRLTGVSVETIISLARIYSYVKPSCLFAGGGPQRSWNGQEWCNMMMGLTAMTGNISRKGGGTGYTMTCLGDKLAHEAALSPGNALGFSGDINVCVNDWAHVILTGKDYRSRERFAEDATVITSDKNSKGEGNSKSTFVFGDLVKDSSKPLLKVSFLQFNQRNNMATSGNVNKCIEAMKKVKFSMSQDHVLTPTALYCDLVLPTASVWETLAFYDSMYQGGMFLINKLVKPIGDAKSDEAVDNLITKKISELTGLELPLKPEDTEDVRKKSYEANPRNRPSKEYLAEYPTTKMPTWEEFKDKAVVEYPVSSAKPFIGLKDPFANYKDVLGFGHVIGELENSTGYINFWSPLWGKIDPYKPFISDNNRPASIPKEEDRVYGDGCRNATMCYEPNPYGYDKFFENADPAHGKLVGVKSKIKGRENYTLLYMTNKARNRSHTMYDNVAMIKDQFPQTVKLHPVDAAKRGIKDGDKVYVYNDRGCMYIPATVDFHIIPGIISVEHGGWYRAHPTEKVTVSLNTGGYKDIAEEKIYTAAVDIGGCENCLTDDFGSTSMQVGFAVSAQGGPCEVSLVKPN